MRTLKFLACVIPIFFLSTPIQAGGKAEESTPALVVQVRSLERIIDHAKLILSLVGRAEIADKVEGLLRAKIGPGGLAGVDPKKPLGIVVHFGKEIHEISPLLLVPISDEMAFLKVLEDNKIRVEKGKNDLYTARVPQGAFEIEVYLRFANGYLYATMLNQDALSDARLIAPAKVLGDMDGPALSATLRIDQMPLAARQIALAEFEKFYAPLTMPMGPGETKGAAEFRAASLDSLAQGVKAILTDGHEVKFTLDLDAKAKKLSANLSLTGREGSDLARALADLGKPESRFGGLLSDTAMFNAAMNLTLPEKMQKAMAAFFLEMKELALGELTDKGKRLQAEGLFALLEPMFKDGRVDAFFLMNVSPEKTLDYLVALGVKDGKKLETTLRDLVEEAKKAMPEKDRAKVQLDFAKEVGVSIHRIEIPEGREFGSLAAILGDSSAYFAFRDDAVFVALGKGGIDALKQAVKNEKPAKAPLLLYRADLAKLATLELGKEGPPDLGKLFPAGSDNHVHIRAEGGRAFTLRMELPLSIFLMTRRVEAK